jgi:hypothetical protein
MTMFSIRDVLAFYDGALDFDGAEATKHPTNRTHSNAINALLGEELGIGLLIHYLSASTDGKVEDEGDCTQGTKVGVRLDRWVSVVGQGGTILYQVEVKNWCAHSLGGRPLEIDADAAKVASHATRTWERYWDGLRGCPAHKPLEKVLTPMLRPSSFRADHVVEPVACVWDLLGPNGVPMPWFAVPLVGKAFERLHWFSMSAYLRQLLSQGQTEIDIPTPQLDARLAVVGRMVPAARRSGSA